MEGNTAKSLLVILLLSSPVFSQDQAAAARMAAGCGPNEVQFEVTPDKHQHPVGDTSLQSRIESRTKTSAAVSLTAEAGKVYYFRTRTPERPVQHETVEFVPVDPAQAQS